MAISLWVTLFIFLPAINPSALAARQAADKTNLRIWDSLSPFSSQVNLRDKTGWKIVPAKNSLEYRNKGDLVIDNDYLTAVFWSKKGEVVIYSKSDKKKVEITVLSEFIKVI